MKMRIGRRACMGLAVLAGALVLTGRAATYYVDANNGSDAWSGTNWSEAKETIQAAVDLAAGDLGSSHHVWVTNGIYDKGGAVATYGDPISNRVWIIRYLNITIQAVSTNPADTLIAGAADPFTGGVGTNAVRCCGVYYNWTGAKFIGFTLTNGYTRATGETWRERSGGGGWYGWYSNCVIAGNTAHNSGGGLSYASAYDCEVRNNQALSGGGLYQAISARGCRVSGNTATDGAGAFGGFYYDSVFSNNAATRRGGAGGENTRFVNCMLVGNSARYGAALYFSMASNCMIRGNSAGDTGGGCSYAGSESLRNKLFNCLIVSNRADIGAGACQGYNTLINCTIVGNSSGDAPGLFGDIAATNCIVLGNTISGVESNYNLTGAGILSCCLTSPDPTGQAYDGGGNRTGDPLFRSPDNGDYHLTANSPGVNAGTNQTWMIGFVDLDGQPRVDKVVRRVDMGCYEWLPSVSIFNIR